MLYGPAMAEILKPCRRNRTHELRAAKRPQNTAIARPKSRCHAHSAHELAMRIKPSGNINSFQRNFKHVSHMSEDGIIGQGQNRLVSPSSGIDTLDQSPRQTPRTPQGLSILSNPNSERSSGFSNLHRKWRDVMKRKIERALPAYQFQFVRRWVKKPIDLRHFRTEAKDRDGGQETP